MPSHPVAIAVALTLLGAPAAAQSPLAVVAGLTSASFTQSGGGTSGRVDRRIGPVAGLGYHLAWQGLKLRPELLYLVKGGGDPASEANLRLAYLQLPVLVRHAFRPTNGVAPFIAAGPAVAVLASCTLHDGLGGSEGCDAAYGESESFRRLDFSLVGTLGVALGRVALSVRYDHGLSNASRAEGHVVRHRGVAVLGSFVP